MGYENDSDEEAGFDFSEAEIDFGPEVNRVKKAYESLKDNHVIEESTSTDLRRERSTSLTPVIFTSDSDQDNLKPEDPSIRKLIKNVPAATPHSQAST